MTPRRWRPRAAALLAGGAFALHQLRYLVGYGAGSHHELAGQGHAYMALLAPLVAAALLLAAAEVCARLAGVRATGRSASPPAGFRRLWLAATGLLLAAYCVQESLEGALAPGHPAGLAALVGHGGWAAAPLAAALGLVVALALRGADRAIDIAAEPPLRLLRPRPLLSLGVHAPGHARGGDRTTRPLGARGPPLTAIP